MARARSELAPSPDYQAVVTTTLFAVGIHCSEDEVLGLEYLPPRPEKRPGNPLAAETLRQIRAYLADPGFTFGLPLSPSGTAFQRRVRAVIAAIPCGRTLTYGDVARAVHSAPRAVGGACGANPFPLVIPCHRVVACGGRLGGFGGDAGGGNFHLAIKRWLLAHEGLDAAGK